MEQAFDTEFLIRRIGQLWAQAAGLPEKSPAQAHIEELACKLSDYVSSPTPERCSSRGRYPDPISAVGDLSEVQKANAEG
jgi:hypothetical protein